MMLKCLEQSRDIKLSLHRKILIFILGFLDNALFGGAVFGWPQLVYVLKEEGVYADLCQDMSLEKYTGNVTESYVRETHSNHSLTSNSSDENILSEHGQLCHAQDERFSLIYTIAVVCYGVPGVVVGFLLHYVGLMATRMIGGIMVSASFIFLALTTADNPNWLFPTMILLSVGGNQIRMSGMQFGDLFPKNRSTTITVLTGVYAASASLFILFPIAQNFGISRQSVCYFFAIFALSSALLSVVMPIHHIPYAETNGKAQERENPETSVNKGSPLRDSLFSVSSHLHNYWFFISLFCINFYQQLYNLWVIGSTDSQEEAGLYTSFFSYSNLISVFCAPVGGMFTDHLIRKSKKDFNDPLTLMTKEIQANFLPLFLTTLFVTIMVVCLLFYNTTAIIISLVCMIIVRPCVIAISTAYLRIRFPGDHYNRLLGIYCTIASALMFFQYPVFQISMIAYNQVMGVMLIFLLISFANPLHILFTERMKKWVILREEGSCLQSDVSQPLNKAS